MNNNQIIHVTFSTDADSHTKFFLSWVLSIIMVDCLGLKVSWREITFVAGPVKNVSKEIPLSIAFGVRDLSRTSSRHVQHRRHAAAAIK